MPSWPRSSAARPRARSCPCSARPPPASVRPPYPRPYPSPSCHLAGARHRARQSQAHGRRRSALVQGLCRGLLKEQRPAGWGPARRRRRRMYLFVQRASPDCVRLRPHAHGVSMRSGHCRRGSPAVRGRRSACDRVARGCGAEAGCAFACIQCRPLIALFAHRHQSKASAGMSTCFPAARARQAWRGR